MPKPVEAQTMLPQIGGDLLRWAGTLTTQLRKALAAHAFELNERYERERPWGSLESLSIVPGYDLDWKDGTNAPRIRRLTSRVAYFDGEVQKSTTAGLGDRIVALPEGWRPARDVTRLVVYSGASGVVQVQAAGHVIWAQAGVLPANTDLFLSSFGGWVTEAA